MGTTIGIGIGIVFLNGVSGAQLSFAGSLTVEKGSAGPHFTLVVLNNPATNPYDGFAEVTDADNVSTIANTDEVTISGALGAHAVSYKATSSGGRPDLTIDLTITLVDTTAPVLTLPTDTKTGQTTATLTVTTDTGEGTLYTVVTTSATPPTSAQVIAGQDHSGVAAAFANSVAVASTGLKTVSATGLTAATAYTTFFVQKDASNNVSAVSAADGFTTDSASFSPASLFTGSIPGAWYDPSDLTTLFQSSGGTTPVAADADPIGYMADKSGNGNTVTQSTSGKRPLYKTSAGLSWALFDGTDDWLTGGDVLDLRAHSWWAVVGVKIASGTSGAIFDKSHTGALAGRYGLIRDSGVVYSLYDVDGVTVAQGGNAADSSTAVRVLTAQCNRASGVISLRANGVAFGSNGSFTPESADQNTADRFLLGAYADNGGGEFAGFFLNGSIYGMILVLANPTGTQITDAEAWMNAKAGL